MPQGSFGRLEANDPAACGKGIAVLVAIVAAGALLRLLLLGTSEWMLDTDEAVVGTMALDFLEGHQRYFFFREQPYNGGAAWEAALGALVFSVVGASAIALKAVLWAMWVSSAAVFADFGRRCLTAAQARWSVIFFCVGTPFFVEWSLKARGGYGEAVALTVLLLWLSRPPPFLVRLPFAQGAAFGVVAGLGLWASEMLLAWVPIAGLWLLLSCAQSDRLRAALGLVVGFCVGLLPLLVWDMNHEFIHAKQSVLARGLLGSGGSRLSLGEMIVSARFILGAAWPLAALGVAVAAARMARLGRVELWHLLLLHLVGYIGAYWISGLRYLEVPPSRVLYVLAPTLALLMAYGAEGALRAGRIPRVLATLALLIWFVAALFPIAPWVASGIPREMGSWRGSWSLLDAKELREELLAKGVGIVVANLWESHSLEFELRRDLHADPAAAPLDVTWRLPSLETHTPHPIAFVLNPAGQILEYVEARLQARSIPYDRTQWGHRIILSGIALEALEPETRLPSTYTHLDWSSVPRPLDGFN